MQWNCFQINETDHILTRYLKKIVLQIRDLSYRVTCCRLANRTIHQSSVYWICLVSDVCVFMEFKKGDEGRLKAKYSLKMTSMVNWHLNNYIYINVISHLNRCKYFSGESSSRHYLWNHFDDAIEHHIALARISFLILCFQ